MKSYKGIGDGDIRALSRSVALPVLHLKVGAPVILTANVTRTLVNGLRGIVQDMHTSHVTVQFNGLDGTTNVHPFRFTVFSADKGKDVASRKQLPLALAFAMTVHKAQGMSIKRLEVDCRHMTFPGQIGVAIERAQSKDGLHVTHFKLNLLKPQPREIREFYDSESTPMKDTLHCCQVNVDSLHQVEQKAADFTPQSSCHEEKEPDSDEELLNFMDMYKKVLTGDAGDTLPFQTTDLLDAMTCKIVLTKEQENLNNQITLLRSRISIADSFMSKIYNTVKSLFETLVPLGNSKNHNCSTFYAPSTTTWDLKPTVAMWSNFF
ncbi:hypothetical protein BSL78_20687 [Apostichopus japonicus]|uniref:DNA helicase Pif1-like 2B domain-containing protein n=1 Tax=Stichopus japonicus TaxID=307972 RepID=A0A2G8K374_STIJA|nr:hypothetical protein BSL78_20687 [Apostichopus japonicus]